MDYKKVLYIFGLYFAFLLNGVFEEKLYKEKYGDYLIPFSNPFIPLFINSALNIMISYLVLLTK